MNAITLGLPLMFFTTHDANKNPKAMGINPIPNVEITKINNVKKPMIRKTIGVGIAKARIMYSKKYP